MLFLIFFAKNLFMKKIFWILFLLIISISIVGILFFSSNNYSSKSNADYLRIHIRANSNSEIDQNIKYKVKDALVEYLTPKISNCKTKRDVEYLVEYEKQSLEKVANDILKQSGFDYVSNIKICSEIFPTRTYEGYTLESGIYDAVIVELGKAEGNNWWCVIYPPLCFTNYSSSNIQSIVYKSKIWEIISQFFS